jgi:hypothetical protein
MKGVFIRMGLMCESIPPPPPNAAAMLAQAHMGGTTRETIEGLTQVSGSSCAGCHATLINPLGFATEGFDALGRARTTERMYAADGSLVSDNPIDSHVVPNIIPGDTAEADDAVALTRLLDESGRVQSCLAREYFRFTFQRTETPATDGCALADIEQSALTNDSLVHVFARAVLVRAFRQKRFE